MGLDISIYKLPINDSTVDVYKKSDCEVVYFRKFYHLEYFVEFQLHGLTTIGQSSCNLTLPLIRLMRIYINKLKSGFVFEFNNYPIYGKYSLYTFSKTEKIYLEQLESLINEMLNTDFGTYKYYYDSIS